MAASSVDLPTSFQRHLRAESKSVRSVETYLEAVQQLDSFLRTPRHRTRRLLHTRAIDLAAADRDDVEAYLAGLLARWKAATAANRYRALRVLYAWLVDEGEIPRDPMAKVKPPRVPDQPAPVPTEELRRRLLATCAGRDFEACRDRALILLLLDTGGRRAEIGGMRLGDVDFAYDVVLVVGKGGRERALPFGNRIGKASTSTYAPVPATPMPIWSGSGSVARARDRLRHRAAPSPPGSGAGIENLHAHLLRHTLRPSLAQPWRRNRPHAVGGLDVSGDAATLRRLGRGRARPRGPSAPFASRPAGADAGSQWERGKAAW